MNAASTSPLSYQLLRFNVLFWRLIDALLNRLFDLRPQAARFRLRSLVFLFLFSGFVISLMYYPLTVWLGYIQDIFGYLLSQSYTQNYPGNPIYNFANYAWQALTDPRVLQYLPIFLAPFFIALQTAANYLADIFELDDPRVARYFVQAVALTGSNETIRISQGNVIEDSKQSPVYLIGGPGRVLVDMDSAALFERPDGTPRVIPSAGTAMGRVVSLDGFERFRQAFDLRPHIIELRDEEGKSAEIRGRSLDGVPISATDVSFQFTVFRNGQLPTAGNPYPFFDNATIENLVYKATSTVKPELPNPSKFEPNWPGSMVGLVRGRLGGFMNEHRLIEYLASIGEPEVDRFNQRGGRVVNAVSNLANPNDLQLQNPNEIPAAESIIKPDFFPRDQLKLLLFNLYADQFTSAQKEKGVELYWIGIGTWRVPTEIFPETGIVPEKHIEAWKISRENIRKEGRIASGKYKEEAVVQKYVTLIQEVPVAKPLSVTTEEERTGAMKALLNAYRLQLIQSAEFLKAKGEQVPGVVIKAIRCLNKVLDKEKDWQWSGPVALDDKCPPAYGFDDGPDDNGPSPRGPGSPGFGSSFSNGSGFPGPESPFPDEPVSPDFGRPSSGAAFTSKQRTESGASEEMLYSELILLLYGDREQADRLIDYERRNFSNESRRQWIERAIERLEKDRKR